MHISRVQIRNFRNFGKLDVRLTQNAVLVGENHVGKSNFLHALRLVLDPSLPDQARKLRIMDFWDGVGDPFADGGASIEIDVDFVGFEEDEALNARLGDFRNSATAVELIGCAPATPPTTPHGQAPGEAR